MSLVPLLPKLMAWNLDGLAFIWLILNHCNIEVQSCCKVGMRVSEFLVSIRQGVIISITVERGLIQKVKNIINKNIEKNIEGQ